MDIIKAHLPEKCYSRRALTKIDGAVIHFISAINTNPAAPFDREAILDIFREYKLSAQYLIERDGSILELVPPGIRAWHAGKSRMNGRDHCNRWTVGIELVGGASWVYPNEQILACGQLLAGLMTEHGFPYNRIAGHDDVRAAWKLRYPDKKAANKVDPGEHFPWRQLAEMLKGAEPVL